MNVSHILLIALGLSASGPMAMGETATLPAGERMERLTSQNQELKALCLRLLEGRHFEVLEFVDGSRYLDVLITGITGEMVSFKHRDGVAEVSFKDGPSEWASLQALAETPDLPVQDAMRPVGEEFREPGSEVADAIVVIEGDQGDGTGFLIKTGGKVFLYTAAHVLSGNKRLAVKMRNGRKIKSFGKFQASEGADLVRLEVTEKIGVGLELGSSAGQAKQKQAIFAAGNAGGGGTVGFEKGRVRGIGAESIEIDAEVIQGNSGGPIIDARSHQALGVVTHLVDARKDQWAEQTRYSDIRRFGCRLDREWQWKDLPIGQFLKEGRSMKEVSDLNELIILAIQPDEWNHPTLRKFEDHRVVKEIRSLQEWIREKEGSGTGVSEADRTKKIVSLFEGIRSSSRVQLRSFKPATYVWFHREMAGQSLLLREELIKSCDQTIENLR